MAVPQVQRFAQMLRRSFSVKAGYDQSLLEDMFPTIEIFGPTMPDNQRLRGEKRWSIFATQPASVGNTSTILIKAAVGKVVVIEYLTYNVQAGANLLVAFTNLSPVIPIQAYSLDGRDVPGGNGVSTTYETRTNIGAVVAGLRFYSQVASPLYYLGIVAVNPPVGAAFSGGSFGSGFVIQGDAVNSSILATVWGYERDLEPSELI